jgi:cell division inhibitor SulA
MSALALVPPAEAGGGLDPLLRSQRVWRANAAPQPAVEVPRRPTGWDELDAMLPAGGWPDAALVEILIAHDGLGELSLLLPMLAACASAERPVLLVAPPYRPYAPAWQRAGVKLAGLQVVDAAPRDALWAMEQALRAGSCAAVLGWPLTADDVHGCTSVARGRMPEATDKALRRLQVATETGQCLGVAFRPARAARNPSPAALRVQLDADAQGGRLRVLKCRGAQPPARSLPLPARARH